MLRVKSEVRGMHITRLVKEERRGDYHSLDMRVGKSNGRRDIIEFIKGKRD